MQETSFGESALALDIAFELVLSVLIGRDKDFGHALLLELDALLAERLPTPGTHAAIERMRNHVEELANTVH